MDYIDVHELYHYGVPGMKWGHHKAPEVTVSNGNRRKTGQQSEEKTRKPKKPFFYKTAVRTSKRLEKFSRRIPGIGKQVYTKKLSDDEHAKRGYAFLATIATTAITVGVVKKVKKSLALEDTSADASVKSSVKKAVASGVKDVVTKKGS